MNGYIWGYTSLDEQMQSQAGALESSCTARKGIRAHVDLADTAEFYLG